MKTITIKLPEAEAKELEEFIKKIEEQTEYESLLVIFSDIAHEIESAAVRSQELDKYFLKVREKLSSSQIPSELKTKADNALVGYAFIYTELILYKKGKIEKGAAALKTELALYPQRKSIPAKIIDKSETLTLYLQLALTNNHLFRSYIEKLKAAVIKEPSSILGSNS